MTVCCCDPPVQDLAIRNYPCEGVPYPAGGGPYIYATIPTLLGKPTGWTAFCGIPAGAIDLGLTYTGFGACATTCGFSITPTTVSTGTTYTFRTCATYSGDTHTHWTAQLVIASVGGCASAQVDYVTADTNILGTYTRVGSSVWAPATITIAEY